MPVHDPTFPLLKVVFKALQEARITSEGKPVLAYEFVPPGAPLPYILISQQTCVPANGTIACRQWSCTMLLDVITSFANGSAVYSLPAALIAEQVIAALENKRLNFDEDFRMSPVTLRQSLNIIDNTTGETIDVHRYLRFNFEIEQHNNVN